MRYDIIVVGGGPAGMTAALYASRAGRSVLLFEGESFGGQIVVSRRIENYPALPDTDGYTFSENLRSQLQAQGVEMQNEAVTGFVRGEEGFSVLSGESRYSARALILATGLKHRRLGVEGEDAFIGRGVSFCATCDGMFFRNREVAVVGGGNTAVQDALVLAEFCSRVYLIHRRMELRAERALALRMREKENIVFLGDTVVERVVGETVLEGLQLKNTKTGETRFLPVAGMFEAIGQTPQNEIFRDCVPLDEDGYFVVDADCATAVEGVFAAGDACRKTVRQLTTAVADGTVAGLSASSYVEVIARKESKS